MAKPSLEGPVLVKMRDDEGSTLMGSRAQSRQS